MNFGDPTSNLTYVAMVQAKGVFGSVLILEFLKTLDPDKV